jgi:hypothetical protein
MHRAASEPGGLMRIGFGGVRARIEPSPPWEAKGQIAVAVGWAERSEPHRNWNDVRKQGNWWDGASLGPPYEPGPLQNLGLELPDDRPQFLGDLT